jgi:hypothetical protein
MVSFVSSSAAGGSCLSAAEILGARKFVAGVVDHVVAGELGRHIRTKLSKLHRNDNRGKNQEGFE